MYGNFPRCSRAAAAGKVQKKAFARRLAAWSAERSTDFEAPARSNGIGSLHTVGRASARRTMWGSVLQKNVFLSSAPMSSSSTRRRLRNSHLHAPPLVSPRRTADAPLMYARMALRSEEKLWAPHSTKHTSASESATHTRTTSDAHTSSLLGGHKALRTVSQRLERLSIETFRGEQGRRTW
eukprot:1344354-Rhodomonas_salina.1